MRHARLNYTWLRFTFSHSSVRPCFKVKLSGTVNRNVEAGLDMRDATMNQTFPLRVVIQSGLRYPQSAGFFVDAKTEYPGFITMVQVCAFFVINAIYNQTFAVRVQVCPRAKVPFFIDFTIEIIGISFFNSDVHFCVFRDLQSMADGIV